MSMGGKFPNLFVLGGCLSLIVVINLTLKSACSTPGGCHCRVSSKVDSWCTLLDAATGRTEGGRRQREQRNDG